MVNIASTMFVEEDVTWIDGDVTETRRIPRDLADVLGVGAKVFEVVGEGVIILDAPVHERMGFPVKMPAKMTGLDVPIVAARTAGWGVGKAPSPWMTFYAPGKPSVHIGLWGWLSPTNHALWADEPAVMTYRMRRYHELTRAAFHGTPGLAGISAVRDRWRGKQPKWVADSTEIEPANQDTEARYLWKSPRPSDLPYAHRYDANVQYLAAAGVTEVALDELRHTGKREFCGKSAGYWKITVPVWNEDRLPNPVNGVPGQEKWVTSPTMGLLAQLAEDGLTVMPDVLDSWTCDRTARVFRPFQERMRDALADVAAEPFAADQDALTKALKLTYKEMIGLLYRPGGRIFRRDWNHAFQGMARSNQFRAIRKIALATGRYPDGIKLDAVTWGSDTADHEAASPVPLRPGPGGWKHEETTERERVA